jgi:hypothetical protein
MNKQFWPIAILFGMLSSSLGAAEREWTVAKHLEVAGQPSHDVLVKSSAEFYRFIYSDPGCTSSTIVLIQKGTNGIGLSACSVDLHGYYAERKATYDEHSRNLSEVEWSKIQETLEALDFWNYTPQKRMGLDGSYWTIEAGKDGYEKSITEWSPGPGSYRDLCLHLWRMSGMFMGMYKNDKK